MRYPLPQYSSFQLRKRWIGEENRIKNILEAINRKQDWTIFLINHEDNPFGPLPKTSDLPTLKGDAGPRDLRGIELSNQSFYESESLAGAKFDFAKLENIDFTKSKLSGSSFDYVVFSGAKGVNFFKAKISKVSFYKSFFNKVIFDESEAHSVDLSDSILKDSSFDHATWATIKFTNDLFFQPLLDILFVEYIFIPFFLNKGTKIFTIRTHPNFIPPSSYSLKRFVKINYTINKLRKTHKLVSFVLYLFTDYFRSLSRLFASFILCWLFFGFIFAGYSVPDFIENRLLINSLTALSPKTSYTEVNRIEKQSYFTPYYYSFVTITSLGDCSFAPRDIKAQIYICIEVFSGYLFLGLLVTALFTRFYYLFAKDD